MPDYDRLPPAVNGITGPVALALDHDGRLYVAETASDRVVVLSQSGRYLSSLAGPVAPISVAVDGDGRILVGSRRTGSVEVYAADLTPLFKLGTGVGEFALPADICVDATGRIYVVDRGNDLIGIYDSSGRFIKSLGSPGSGSGQLYRPVSMAIDEAAGEVVVLDRQLVAGTSRQGARVQYFGMDGSYLRGFTRNGDQEGGMVRPQGITVDAAGRIYVTDSYQNAVLVYDNAGTFLGAVYDLDDPLRAPLGTKINGTNRLYIASRMAKRVEVYGIDRYTALEVDPDNIEFTVKEGGVGPATQSIAVRNSGSAAINWAAAAAESWLEVSVDSGVLSEGQAAMLDVAVDTSGLDPGEYTGRITISAGPGATEVVRVFLTVEPAAGLAVMPKGLSFISEVGTTPAPEKITVANTGSVALHWNLAADQAWIALSRNSGTVGAGESGSEVTVLADVSSLAAGTYTGTITVAGLDAGGSPSLVGVTLQLADRDSGPGTGPAPAPAPGTTWQGNSNREWTVAAQSKGIPLNSIWGSSGTDIVAVGDRGTILHYDGRQWNEEDLFTAANLYGVWGTSPADIYAVGERGLVLHYDGNAWRDASPTFSGILRNIWFSGSEFLAVGQGASILIKKDPGQWVEDYSLQYFGSLRGIWGSSGSDIYAVGDFGALLHNDGSGWQFIDLGTDATLYDIWGSGPDNVYVAGLDGLIFHYDGKIWVPMDSGTSASLKGIWGNAADEVYAVGERGTMLLYQGFQWKKLEAGIDEDLNDAWSGRKREIYAVGSGGSVLFNRAVFPWDLLHPILIHNGKQEQPLSGD